MCLVINCLPSMCDVLGSILVPIAQVKKTEHYQILEAPSYLPQVATIGIIL
jgi:hypothetical protein